MIREQKRHELEKKLTEAVIAEVREWRGVMPIRNADDFERTMLEVFRYLIDRTYPEK